MAVGIPIVVSVTVVTAALWPGHERETGVTVSADDTATAPASDGSGNAEEWAARYGRAGVVAAVDRTTSEGTQLDALVVDTHETSPQALSDLPDECSEWHLFDVVTRGGVDGVEGEVLGQVVGTMPEATGDSIALGSGFLTQTVPRTNSLPDGSTDPRLRPTEADPAEPPTLPVDVWNLGVVVAARGEHLAAVSIRDGDRVDRADAVDGFATVSLGWRSDGPTWIDPGVELELNDGTVVAVPVALGSSQLVGPDGAALPTVPQQATQEGRCVTPTPQLPAPGDQPDDVEGARSAVVAAIETLADGSLDADQRLGALDDPDRGRRILAELDDSEIAGAATSTATVSDVVFVSPTEAIVRMDIHVPSVIAGLTVQQSLVNGAFGKVTLSDGGWRVTTGTICRVLRSITPDACDGVVTRRYPSEAYPTER